MNQDYDFQVLEQTLSTIRPRLLLAPPRTASTALARALSSHSSVGPGYVHEPCDLYAHQGASLQSISDSILQCTETSSVLVKEMTFQMGTGEVFRLFTRHTFDTIVVLIREPILAIESRIRKVCEDLIITQHGNKSILESAIINRDYRELEAVLDDNIFPMSFTGWDSLSKQIEYFDQHQCSYCVIESSDFRNYPRQILIEICAIWGLSFEEMMLKWDNIQGNPQVGSLAEQSHWYTRVLDSHSVLPPTEEPIKFDKLPRRFRKHLNDAQSVYFKLLQNSNRISIKKQMLVLKHKF